MDFSEQCKNANAYYLFSYQDVTYTKNWLNYTRLVTVSNKLVLNNSKGVDLYAYLDMSEAVANNIVNVEVKTLKANGNIIELDSARVFARRNSNNEFDAVHFPVPGVEPGDTIFTNFTYQEFPAKGEMMDFVLLQSKIPSMKTEYSIKSRPELEIRYKGYNGMAAPTIVSNDTLLYCVFGMKNLKAIEENEYTCIPCQLPYAYYSMEEKDEEGISWEKLYNKGFNLVTQPVALDRENSSYYNRWKRSILKEAEQASKYEKFRLLYTDIMTQIEMEQPRIDELLKSSGYFLKEKRINQISLRRLYRRILEELEIDYWAVFARSKRGGAIDPYFIRSGEFDHIFFAMTNASGELEFIYPHDEYTQYEINEIPPSLYNTRAVVVQPTQQGKRKHREKFIGGDLQLAEADSVKVSIIQLPQTNASHNYIKQVYYVDIASNRVDFPAKYRLSVAGGIYTDVKAFFGLRDQEEEVAQYYDALSEYEGDTDAFEMDTVTTTDYRNSAPYGLTLSGEGQIKEAISFLNEDMISIALEDIISHNQIENLENIGGLDYYLDYSYSDFIMLILKFPTQIEVLNHESYDVQFENEFGEYIFDLKVIDGNQVTIQSNYKINREVIPNKEQSKLAALNDLTRAIQNKRILVKLLN